MGHSLLIEGTPANVTSVHSPPHPPIPPPHPSRLPSPPRNPLSAHNTAPLPLHAPTPPQRHRPRRLPRRALDLPHNLGPGPARRKRHPLHPLGANALHARRRKPNRLLENDGKDKGEGHGRAL